MARSHGYSSGIHCRIISEKNRKEFLHAISVHLVPCHVSPHLKTVPSLSVHFSQLRYCFLVWLDSSSSIHSRPRNPSEFHPSTILQWGRCDSAPKSQRRHDFSPRRTKHGPVVARESLRPHEHPSFPNFRTQQKRGE